MSTFEKVGFAVASPDHGRLYIIWNPAKSLLNVIGSIDPPLVEKLPVFIALSNIEKKFKKRAKIRIYIVNVKVQ